MTDWTFGLGILPPSRSGRGNVQQRKTAEQWLKQWSERLAQWLDASNMSQSSLAKKLDVSPMTVSRWTRGFARPTDEAAANLSSLISQHRSSAPSDASPAGPLPKTDVTESVLHALKDLRPPQQIAYLFISMGKVFEKMFEAESPIPSAASPPPAPASAPPMPAVAKVVEKAPSPAKPKPRTKPRLKKKVELASQKAQPKNVQEITVSTWPALIEAIQRAEGWGEGKNRRLAEALKVAPSTISNWLKNLRIPRDELRDQLFAFARKHAISTSIPISE